MMLILCILLTYIIYIKSELEPIGYMHIDTEGWDCAVLKGSREILLNPANSPMYIVTECWPDHVAKQQVNKGRAKGVASNTPNKDIMDEMKSYNDIQLIHELKDEDNLLHIINIHYIYKIIYI